MGRVQAAHPLQREPMSNKLLPAIMSFPAKETLASCCPAATAMHDPVCLSAESMQLTAQEMSQATGRVVTGTCSGWPSLCSLVHEETAATTHQAGTQRKQKAGAHLGDLGDGLAAGDVFEIEPLQGGAC